MKLSAFIAALAFTTACAHASDLFVDGKPTTLTQYAPLPKDATIGGYPIYRGQADWRIEELASTLSGTQGNAHAITRGTAALVEHAGDGQWLATMVITANLNSGNASQYTLGAPCAGEHAAAINKNFGFFDNCLTIDPYEFKTRGQSITYLGMRITQTRSAGRGYYLFFATNVEAMGFKGTSPSDWSPNALAQSPQRKAFLQRLTQWGGQLQDATARATEWSKPQDVFKDIPHYATLAETGEKVSASAASN